MKNIIKFLGITLLLYSFGCSSDRPNRRDRDRNPNRQTTSVEKGNPDYLKIRDIDGNTLELVDGRKITLIGIEDTPEVESYLRTLLKTDIRYVFDSKSTPRRPEKARRFVAYVIDEDGTDLSARMLKEKISPLNREKLRDSLVSYKEYSTKDYAIVQNSDFPVDNVRNASFHINRYKDGQRTGTGSGFFVNDEGIGISNFHVFDGGERFLLESCEDETQYEVATILDLDRELDYVIFTTSGIKGKVSYLPMNFEPVEQGDKVFVYGNPKGLDCVLSDGIISAVRGEKVVQITAPISPGNSGSPVTNDAGEAIGIATFKKIECENCNFAMSISVLQDAIRDYVKKAD